MNLEQEIRSRAKRVDTAIEAVLEGIGVQLSEPMKYHTLSGGKRVRPFLCLLSCEISGGNSDKAVNAASALELAHSFTLVHDDIMDEDDLRRGRESLWKKYGTSIAINTGDGLFSLSYGEILKTDADSEILLRITKEFSKSIIKMCEGQSLDLDFEIRETVSFEEYIEMSALKTGAFLEASVTIGAVLGGASDAQLEALSKYSKNWGLAFQLWDDFIDFSSDSTGKTKNSDIKRGKKTSIVCHALSNLELEDKKRLLEILNTSSNETSDDSVSEAVSLLEKSSSIKFVKEKAEAFLSEAKSALDIFPDSEAKNILLEFADYCIKRKL
ncbi:MAG: polyprenyl synthetase family protein [archaeon]|jgi:geranylgeranyl diphosphate synthase type I|nr:hypothetical protein [Euryarchaeota archaeon]MDP6704684.1 polyprenyl synthetase family protein [archaeon]HIK01076.1 polyprenyl synthetase family protein [Candidatus Undinarchaeales archaeon ERR594346 U_76725]|tara:strand:+ start:16132 stop:17112 length:981 start_codon:yes stop_codon:yes gene_type:complete